MSHLASHLGPATEHEEIVAINQPLRRKQVSDNLMIDENLGMEDLRNCAFARGVSRMDKLQGRVISTKAKYSCELLQNPAALARIHVH